MARFPTLIRTFQALLALLALLAAPALAKDEDADYTRSGAYVVGTLQLGLVTTTLDPVLFTAATSWEPAPGGDVRLGWREDGRLALEVEVEWISNTSDIQYGSWSLGPNVKYFILQDAVQPYILLGGGGYWSKMPFAPQSVSDWGFRHGVGVDWYLTENWALEAETTFLWGVGDVWGRYYMTFGVGAMYRF